MKVLFADPLNTQNNFYIYAKYLRQKGIDVVLAIESANNLPEGHRLYWHDKKLRDLSKHPDWLYRMEFPLILPFQHLLEYLARWIELGRLVKKFDLIVCSGFVPIWIANMGKPFIYISHGSDLDQEAVQGWSGVPRNHSGILQKLVHFVMRYQMRWAIRKAKIVVLSPYQIRTAKMLGLKNLHFLPHVVDTELFKPMSDKQRKFEKVKLRKKLDCDFILFHPPRQVWADRLIADCKGNDKVFRAFAKFVQTYRKKAKLVVVEKGWDLDASKALVKELGISDYVKWVQPMPKEEMYKYYNASDIVLDQFVVGVLALVSVEAMACGVPVLTYVGSAPKGMFYSEMPPVVNAHREWDIYRGMCRLAENKDMRDELGKQGRDWIEMHCHPNKALQKYIELFEELS